MRIRRALRWLALGSGLLALAGSLAVGTAQAAPIEKGTFHDVGSHTSDTDREWPCGDLGFIVTIAMDIHGSFHYGPRKPGGVSYGMDTEHGWVSYSANGNTYMDVFNVLNKDYKVTVNPDGSWTVIAQGTGTDSWFLNGTRLYRDTGLLRYQLLVTNPGQPNEQVTFVGIVKGSTGVNNGPTGQFCSDLAKFLAPKV